MKSTVYAIGFLLILISAISCNDDFLSENKKTGYILNDTLVLNITQTNVETSIVFPAKINSEFTIFMQPKWMSFKSMHGKVVDGNVPLSFSIDKTKIPNFSGSFVCNLVLDLSDIGLISVPVMYLDQSVNGNPELTCSPSILNFNGSNNLSFTISNISRSPNNTVTWSIAGLPEWLSVSESSGCLASSSSITLNASLIVSKITPGQEYNAILQIFSNSVGGTVNLGVHVTASQVINNDIKIAGIVTDAEYNQNTNIMAICTKSPNSLIIYNTSTKTSRTLDLAMTPNCISISEDGHKAAIGYSVANISYVDLDAGSILKDVSINYVPFDIVIGDNSWCYVTPTTGQWVAFTNVNLQSGQVVRCNNIYRTYERTIIKKVPGQPYMVGTCTVLSPSGIDTYKLSNGLIVDTIGHYHTDGGNIWVSRDSKKVYTRTKKIYQFPKYDLGYYAFEPSIYGQLDATFDFISGFDECQSINSFFGTCYSTWSTNADQGIIIQYNTTNLNKIRTYTLSKITIDNSTYSFDARYIFVNKAGSELYAIKNVRSSNNMDYWTLEKITVDATGN